MRVLTVCFAAFFALAGVASSLQGGRQPSRRDGLYDANPNHLWNRIHQSFHVRVAPDGSEYGFDTVDPLLWRETRHLLTGSSHMRAVIVLDEFLTSSGERLIADPLKRAVFQHDLWTIFDWLASTSEGDQSARTELAQRLARVIRRLALTRRDIETLPDTYIAAVASGALAANRSHEQPVLPSDLFSAAGPWVSVGGVELLAPQHATELSRSAFIVLWSVPGGSTATARYLKTLWDFPQPFVSDEIFQLARDGEVRAKINRAMPEIPDGTRIALVRKMLLIDDAGVIVPSNLVESIQLRTFPGRHGFSELKMSRADLFTGTSGGLRAVSADDTDFITFSAHGMDPFEVDSQSWRGPPNRSRVLDGCTNCHHVGFEAPIETVLSLRRILKPAPLVDSRHERWARAFTQPIAAAEAKRRSYEWGLIEGLWQTQPR